MGSPVIASSDEEDKYENVLPVNQVNKRKLSGKKLTILDRDDIFLISIFIIYITPNYKDISS